MWFHHLSRFVWICHNWVHEGLLADWGCTKDVVSQTWELSVDTDCNKEDAVLQTWDHLPMLLELFLQPFNWTYPGTTAGILHEKCPFSHTTTSLFLILHPTGLQLWYNKERMHHCIQEGQSSEDIFPSGLQLCSNKERIQHCIQQAPLTVASVVTHHQIRMLEISHTQNFCTILQSYRCNNLLHIFPSTCHMSLKLNSSGIVLSSDSYVQIGRWCHICSLSSQLILCKEIANVKQKTIS